MATTDRTPMGIAHPTVVPDGFDPERDGLAGEADEDEDEDEDAARDPAA
jgi:hypothetical protein